MHSRIQLSSFKLCHGVEEGCKVSLNPDVMILEVVSPRLARAEADKLFLVMVKNP